MWITFSLFAVLCGEMGGLSQELSVKLSDKNEVPDLSDNSSTRHTTEAMEKVTRNYNRNCQRQEKVFE